MRWVAPPSAAAVRPLIIDMHATIWPLFMTSVGAHMQVPYSRLMHGLAQENIRVNRKVLSELAMNEPHSFKALVDQARPVCMCPSP